jgi:uncharacterized protein (TIGR03437 family)
VSVNGQNIPLFYVSSTQISALVPYSISAANGVNYATFKVTSNSTTSNPVTMYVRNSSPGIFSLSQNGVGPAAAEHADYSVVSSSNPAHPGETVMIYLGGLGAVSPAVQDGYAAPTNPPSSATGSVSITFNSQTGVVPAFAGLTPTAAGLYQLNVTIPSTLGAGDVPLDVVTTDGSTSEATIRVGP